MSPASNSPASRLAAEQLSVGYDDRTVVDRQDLAIADGQITTIIGPNGCGKSTLLRAMARLLPARTGRVLLDGDDIRSLPPKQVARTLGLLPQQPLAPEGLLVSDLVARGRHPHQSWYRQWSTDDAEAVQQALALTGTVELADRPIEALSGGQRQRVWIALTLAQQTDLLLLDEPTTYLDLAHSVEVLDLVHDLRTVHGKTVVMVLHDLNLAARYSDRIVVMADGAVIAEGSPAEILTAELLRAAFGLDAVVVDDPVSGGPLIVPIGARAVPHASGSSAAG